MEWLPTKFKRWTGQTIDMYQLAQWLGTYNRKNNVYLLPSKLKKHHILEYLKERNVNQ